MALFKTKTVNISQWASVDRLALDILNDTNTLIAGTVGSGKSVLENTILHTFLSVKTADLESPDGGALILIDPKRVELSVYKTVPHCVAYTADPLEALQFLDNLIAIMDSRYIEMEKRHLRKWDKGHIYVFIDEMADLMTTNTKRFTFTFRKLMQLSRAAGIHVIACTQSPSRRIIPSDFQILFTTCVGLRCRSAIESRQIIGISGCEALPQYGQALVLANGAINRELVNMTDERKTDMLIRAWSEKRRFFRHN